MAGIDMKRPKRVVKISHWFYPILIILLLTLFIYSAYKFWSKRGDPSEVVVKSLIESLHNDESARARGSSARALGKIGNQKAVESLLQAYETDILIRREVVYALRDLGISPSKLLHMSEDIEDTTSFFYNIREYIRDFNLYTYLISTAFISLAIAIFFYMAIAYSLSFLSEKVRFSIATVVFLSLGGFFIWLYLSPPHEKSINVNTETAEAAMIELAAATGDKTVLPTILKILSSPLKSSKLRVKAAETIGILGTVKELTILLEIAKDTHNDEEIRIFSLWAIGNIAAKEDKREKKFDYDNFLVGKVEDYDQVLSLDPTNPYVHLARGVAQTDQGNYSQAIADFNKAIMYKPSLSETYYRRGIAYILNGNAEKAIADFTQALIWNFNVVDVYYRRANAYMEVGKIDSALNDFETCKFLDPQKPDIHLSLGLAYRELNQTFQAIEEFRIYLSLFPEAPDAEVVKGWIQELNSETQ